MAIEPLICAYRGNEQLADAIVAAVAGERGAIEQRRFPDGETYVRLNSDPAGRRVIIVAALDRPDEKVLPLVFLADTARELGAASVELVAPYLCYMRQDARFKAGEGVTSRYFARVISQSFDALFTVEPHLHRLAALTNIYTIPAVAVRAAPALADWMREHVDDPIVVGPDAESRQLAADVADRAGAPMIVLAKQRIGDRMVIETPPDADHLRGRTPVLVDDIIASAATMVEAIRLVLDAGSRAPVCLAVHAVFANDAYMHLVDAGAARIATSNTIRHPSNAADIVPLLAAALVTAEHGIGRPTSRAEPVGSVAG